MPHYGHAHRNRHKTTDTRTVFHDPYTLEQPNGEERMVLFPKDTVEVFDHDRGRSLLTIKYFEQEFSHPEEEPGSMNIRVFIVGRRYIRFRDYEDLGGFLAQSPYEVCETSRGRYNISQIRRKVKLIKTNNHEYREFQAPSTFLCRYIRRENAIVGLSAEQADEGRTRIDDTRKRNMFIHHRAKPPVRQPRARYTFGDGFCGVGGCSAGARMAGLNVKWAFDADPATCRIYSENFPRANVMLARVDQFLSLGNLGYVDVMHLSPPCQTWSMAHTIPGCNDDMNSACLFAVELLLKTYRPRIATLEQVPGIVRKIDNQNFFHSMLRIFLDNGYSIEWKILKTQDFGVPQTRERLILLASCPGQSLPEFPPPTHGTPPLPPYVSLANAIREINTNDRLHDIRPFPTPRYSVIDPYMPLPATIKTSNPTLIFPDGTRPFTKRELARCQTFSDAHIFGESNVERHIGNAVPPLFARRIFENIIKKLQDTDGFI